MEHDLGVPGTAAHRTQKLDFGTVREDRESEKSGAAPVSSTLVELALLFGPALQRASRNSALRPQTVRLVLVNAAANEKRPNDWMENT